MKPRDLAIHGIPDMALIKRAKASLGVDWTILPRPAQTGDWNVLAFGGKPPWVCKYAYSPSWTEEKLAAALMALCGGKEDSRVVSMARSLELMFDKKGVREIE